MALLHVGLAALAAFIFGAAWYTALGRNYQVALGRDPEQCKGQKMPLTPMLICFLGEVVMAYALCVLFQNMRGAGWAWGAETGAIIGAGIILPTVVVNNVFPSRKPMLTVIDGAHWIGVAAIMGAVLGAFA